MDLLKDPDGVYLIETTGVLDAALNKDTFADARKITNDLLITHYAAQDVASKALYEGRSIRINGDLVTLSLDAYKKLANDAELGRWRKVSEEPPPIRANLIRSYAQPNGAYAPADIDQFYTENDALGSPNDLWRPLS